MAVHIHVGGKTIVIAKQARRVRDAFGMQNHELELSALGSLETYSGAAGGEHKLFSNAKDKIFGYDTSKFVDHETFKAGLQEFVKAMHAETQDYFKEHGITEIVVCRGQRVKGPDKPEVTKFKMQPASSFSTAPHIARRFAGSSNMQMLVAKVPVSQVIGSYRTGYGCTQEHEVVVLAHKELRGVAMKVMHSASTTVGGLLNDAAAYINK